MANPYDILAQAALDTQLTGYDVLPKKTFLPEPPEQADKITKLQNAVANKLSVLSEDTLIGMQDADSLYTQKMLEQSFKGGREDLAAVPYAYDAVELPHGQKSALAGVQASSFHKEQPALVSKMVGKPINELTEQDYIDVGNWQQIQKLSDLAREPGADRWEAPFIHDVEPTNLTGRYIDEYGKPIDIPLDVPITSAIHGKDKYDRALYESGDIEGTNVTAMHVLDPILNAKYAQVVSSAATDAGADSLKILQNKLKDRESSGNYEAENNLGYIGAYQFGIARLKDLGIVKQDAPNNNAALNDPSVWTGKYDIDSKQSFLASPEVQDKIASEHLADLAVSLKDTATDDKDLLGKIAAAHLLGVKGSKDLSKTDANYTSGLDYYNLGSSIESHAPSEVQQSSIETRLQELYGTEGKTTGSSIENALKGFGVTLAEGVVGTLDLVPEVAEYAFKNIAGDEQSWSKTEGLYTKEGSKAFKEWAGYNEEILSQLGEEFTSTLKDAVEQGNYWKVVEMAGKAFTTPELIATSFGYVAGLMLPGTLAKRGIEAASGVTKAAKALRKANSNLTKAEALAKAEKKTGTGYKILKTMAGEIGYVGGAEQFGRDAEELYENTYGSEMPAYQKLISRGIGMLYVKMDAGMAKALVLGKDPIAKAIPGVLKKLPKKMQTKVLGKIAVMAGVSAARVTGAFGTETLTEGVQTAMEQVAGKYKEGEVGVGKILEESKYDIATAGLMGGVGGTQMAAPSIALDIGKTAITPERRKEMIDNIINRKKAKEQPTTEEPIVDRTAEVQNVFETRDNLDDIVSDVIDSTDVIDELASEGTLNTEAKAAYDSKVARLEDTFNAIETEEQAPIFRSKEIAEDFLTAVVENKRLDKVLESKIDIVAKVNGLDKEAVTRVKNITTVEQEVVEGKRSYNTYGRKLKKLIQDPEKNEEAINKTVASLNRIKETSIQYADAVKGGIKDAEAKLKANKQTKGVGMPTGRVEQLPIVIPAEGARKNEHTLKISVSPKGIQAFKTILERKESNVAGIDAILKAAGKEYAKAKGTSVPSDTILVPTTDDPEINKRRKADRDYYEKHEVTKAIIGDKATKKWATYNTLETNKSKTNTGVYEKKDVVVLNADIKKRSDNIEAAEKIEAEIAKAKKAGATIVIDRDVTSKAREYLVTQLTQKWNSGVVYHSLKERPNVFKPKEEAAKEHEEFAKEAAKKGKRTKANDNLVLTYADLRSKGFNDTQIKRHGDFVLAMIDAKDYYAREGLSSSDVEANMFKHAKDSYTKQVEILSKKYIDATINDENFDVNNPIVSEETYNKVAEAAGIINASIKEEAESVAQKELETLSDTENLLQEWKELVDKEASTKELQEFLDRQGIKEKESIESGIKNSSSNIIKEDQVYLYTEDGKQKLSSTKPTGDVEGKKLFTHIKDYVVAGKVTALNTLKVEAMGPLVNSLVSKATEYLLADKKGFIELDLDTTKTGKRLSNYEYALVNSPARGLLIENVDGKDRLNKNVLAAMVVALREQVMTNSYVMSDKFKNKETIATLHGVEEWSISNKNAKVLSEKGILQKTLANDLGKSITQQLGLKVKKDLELDREQFQMLQADLGNMAMLLGISEGLLEFDSMLLQSYMAMLDKPTEGLEEKATVGFVKISKEKFGTTEKPGLVEQYKKEFQQLEEHMPIVNTLRRGPSFKAISKEEINKRTRKISKDRSGFEPAEEAKEALESFMKQGYSINKKGVQFVLDNEDAVKNLMGWVAEDDPRLSKMTFDEKEVLEATNRDIEKSIDELKILMEDTKDIDKPELFFKWFYSKNGRYMLESNTINPQTDKQLHRFLVTPSSHEIMYEITYGDDGKVQFSLKDWVHKDKLDDPKADLTGIMMYALSQAFGMDVDKKPTKEFTNKMSKVLTEVSSGNIDIEKAKKEFFKEGKITIADVELEIEHIAHAIQGFEVLEAIAKKDKSLTSTISAEFDAVTSGFGIKIMQMPVIGRALRYALKVGIVPKSIVNPEDVKDFTENDIEFFNEHKGLLDKMGSGKPISMNDILGEQYEGMPLVSDSYQTLAMDVTGMNNTYASNELRKQLDRDDSLDTKIAIDGRVKRALTKSFEGKNTVWNSMSSILPQYESGAVAKELRSLFKSPFMVFNYSASIKSIRAAVAAELTDKLLKEFLDNDALAKKVLSVTGGRLDTLRHDIKAKDSSTVMLGDKVPLRGYLEAMMNVTYGAKIEEVLKKEFAPFLEVQEAVNLSFKAMFQAYNVELKEQLDKVQKEQMYISEEDAEAIMADLKHKFPAIKGPLSKDTEYSEDLVPIYGTKTASPKGHVAAQTHINAKWAKNNLTKEQTSLKIWHKVKEFSAAISAGSVVPIHYIDGAAMGRLMNSTTKKYGETATTSIHDAIIPSMIIAEESVKQYNKEFIDTVLDYSVVEKLINVISKVQETAKNDKFNKEKEKILLNGEEVEMTVRDMVNAAFGKLQPQAEKIAKAREEFKGLLGKGAYIMHMAGTANSVYEYKGKKGPKKPTDKRESKVEDDTIDKEKIVEGIAEIYNNAPTAIKKVMMDAAKAIPESSENRQLFTVRFKEIIENC